MFKAVVVLVVLGFSLSFSEDYFSGISNDSKVLDCGQELKIIVGKAARRDTSSISCEETILNLQYIAKAIKSVFPKKSNLSFPEKVREVANNFDKYNKKSAFRRQMSKVFVKNSSEGVAFAQ